MLIPGHNDSDAEIDAECGWLADNLGADVPLHFTAFHPDFKMRDVPPTPPSTLRAGPEYRAGTRAAVGLHRRCTRCRGWPDVCPGCSAPVVERTGAASIATGSSTTDDALDAGRCCPAATTGRWSVGGPAGFRCRSPAGPGPDSCGATVCGCARWRSRRSRPVTPTRSPRWWMRSGGCSGSRRRVRPVAVVAPHTSSALRAGGCLRLRSPGPVARGGRQRGGARTRSFHAAARVAIPSVGAFATPLGPVPVDADARAVAVGLSAVVVDDEPHAGERHRNAASVSDPHTGPGGTGSPGRRGRHAALCCCHSPVHRAGAAGTIVVVSTDLSDYLNRAQARERDTHTRRPSSTERRCASTRRRMRLPSAARAVRHAAERDLVVEQLQLVTSADTEAIPGASSDTGPSCVRPPVSRPWGQPRSAGAVAAWRCSSPRPGRRSATSASARGRAPQMAEAAAASPLASSM